MGLDSIKGRGSTLKFKVMTDLTKDPQGNYKRPLNFAATALSIPEVTTSDMPFTVASEANPVPVMYGSPAPGAGERWADPDPGEVSWAPSFSGNVQPVDTDRAAMEALKLAGKGRKIIWLERTPNGETVAEGGAFFITQGQFPVPADAAETFSFSGAGKGKCWDDTSAATVGVS